MIIPILIEFLTGIVLARWWRCRYRVRCERCGRDGYRGDMDSAHLYRNDSGNTRVVYYHQFNCKPGDRR